MIEAQSAARIDHQNVVKIFDVLTEDGKPWLVMQLVHGQTLAQQLRDGPLTRPRHRAPGRETRQRHARQHRAGPADRLLHRQGDRPGITRNSDVWGTPGYIAPELVKNWTPGPPSDLFGLGVLLFRAVEGYGPCGRDIPEAAMIASVTEPHPRRVRAGPLTPARSPSPGEDSSPARPSTLTSGGGGVSNLGKITNPVANADGDFGPIIATLDEGQMGPNTGYSIEAKGGTSGKTASAPISIEAS